MSKGYVAIDRQFGTAYFAGGFYVVHGEKYPNNTNDITKAKVYKNEKRLQSIIDNGQLPEAGGWNWKTKEIDI